MKYDFDTPINRFGSGSLKWDISDSELPMWVADMDFQTAPQIREAILKRAEHGIFGYSVIPEEWQKSYVNWWRTQHGFELHGEWLIFCTGVVPAISSAVRKLTTPAEKVLIQTPVYNIFFNSIINSGRQVLESPLIYKNGEYSMDLDDLDKKLSDPQVSLMILCNPHNPVGKIWGRSELEAVGELCKKHGVTVISDEIHCDLTDIGESYTPFASVSEVCKEISITCIAPTKTFNLAGIQSAAVSVPNPLLRHKMWRALNTDEVAEPGAFAVPATIAAFDTGAEWLYRLREYIGENKAEVKKFLEERLPQIYLVPSKATYLLWLDCSKITDNASELTKIIREKTGLYLSSGEQYGNCGKAFIRMNIACPRSTLLDGLMRLDAGVTSLY